ncbi:MAG: hypothetical protein U0694_20190 [Anaerolineae bacterium]
MARTGYLATLNGLPDGARKRANVEKLLTKRRPAGRSHWAIFSSICAI